MITSFSGESGESPLSLCRALAAACVSRALRARRQSGRRAVAVRPQAVEAAADLLRRYVPAGVSIEAPYQALDENREVALDEAAPVRLRAWLPAGSAESRAALAVLRRELRALGEGDLGLGGEVGTAALFTLGLIGLYSLPLFALAAVERTSERSVLVRGAFHGLALMAIVVFARDAQVAFLSFRF